LGAPGPGERIMVRANRYALAAALLAGGDS
jgi:hypothetical protein